jgi:hydrogenase maturation protease
LVPATPGKDKGDTMNVLVLGVGNVLMGDDSIGVRVVDEIGRRFHLPEGVEILDGGTSGMELLSYISGRKYLIIVDAIKSGLTPGTVVKVEGEDVPVKFMTRISPHQLGLSDVLAAATVSGQLPENMVLFGIEPKRVELGFDLSDEVRAGFEKLVQTVIGELTRLGYTLEPRKDVDVSAKSIWENIES